MDIVIEGVGHADALKTGFDLMRPWGNISSFGVHNEPIPWTGSQAYGKNLKIQMGRCPVRSMSFEILNVPLFSLLFRKASIEFLLTTNCRYLRTSIRDAKEEPAFA